MDELKTIVDNTEKDNTYRVIEVLKENNFQKTEKVEAPDGSLYLRKYFMHDNNFSSEKLAFLSKLDNTNLPKTYDNYDLAE